jgi:hypothetical protein
MENVTLQLKTVGVPVVLHLSQYDTNRSYLFTPYYGTEPYAYQTDAHVYIEATKPDKTIVNAEATYNEDGTISYTVPSSLTQVAGDVRAKMTWIKNSKRLASAAIVFACDAAGISTYAKISESDLTILRNVENQIASLDENIKKAEDAATKAEDAATKADDTIAKVDDAVEEINTAKSSAIDAVTSAQTTATDAIDTTKTTAVSDVDSAKATAVEAVDSAKSSAVNAISTEKTTVISAIDDAKTSAVSDVQNSSKLAESWAVGGTGSRDGEDSDNAKYYAEQAAKSASSVAGVASFNGRSGAVVPQNGDYSYDMITGTPPVTTYDVATESSDGLMSSTDKTKLDGVDEGANKTVVDTTVTESSVNAVSSGAVYTAVKAVKDSIPTKTTLTKTLVAGETTLTFTDDAITNNAVLDVYSNMYGISPTMASQVDNTLTLTYGATTTDVMIRVVIS